MCRNITTLRGLEPVATEEEIIAAARQYCRKISGVQKVSAATEEAFERAVAIIDEATTDLIEAQRGYELNAKVITAADQMLGATTQIR